MSALRVDAFPCDLDGFYHVPVLVSGLRDALLIDGVFGYRDGRALAARITAADKRLRGVFISCNDPDYYFGLRPVFDAFPGTAVFAAAVTVDAIASNVAEKLVVWRERIGEDGPRSQAELVLPEVYEASSLALEDERIEIVTVTGLFDRRFLWLPSIRTVLGGGLVSSGHHIFMADTPTPADVAAWIAALDAIAALGARTVIPGHACGAVGSGEAALAFTRAYLRAFEEASAEARDARSLVAEMGRRYPHLPDAPWLALGAQVRMGETTWGRPTLPPPAT